MSEVNELAALVNAAKVHQVEGLTAPFVVLPPDHEVKGLVDLLPEPARIVGTVTAKTAQSLIDYANAYKSDKSAVFANQDSREIRVLLDYHKKDQPSRNTHAVLYKCPFSREWQAWSGINGKDLNQVPFADFLEEHVADVVEPTGAHLLEIATKFQVTRKAVFGSAVRLNTGEYQFQFSDENQKGSVEVPGVIKLGIPVFHNGKPYEVTARLRYRLDDGKLTFTVKLNEPERIVEHAFNGVAELVRKDLVGVPFYDAAP